MIEQSHVFLCPYTPVCVGIFMPNKASQEGFSTESVCLPISIRSVFNTEEVSIFFLILTHIWLSTITGLDYWTGLLDWTTGLDYWTGLLLDWTTTGLDYWTTNLTTRFQLRSKN